MFGDARLDMTSRDLLDSFEAYRASQNLALGMPSHFLSLASYPSDGQQSAE